MLQSIKELQGCAAVLASGKVTSVDDIYFDDAEWTLRYIVLDTGGWLTGRKLLISPHAVGGVNWSERTVKVILSQAPIERSPDIEADSPVLRQDEIALYDYYGSPYYWMGPYPWGYEALPMMAANPARHAVRQHANAGVIQDWERSDAHLRSSKEVLGYRVQAADHEIGRVEDFLFSVDDWSIQMMVVATRSWCPGKHVLLRSQSIEHVSRSEHNVVVDVTGEDVEGSAQYEPVNPRAHAA